MAWFGREPIGSFAAAVTHNQTSPPHLKLPNFGRSFISALRPLLAAEPAISNVATGRWFRKQADQVRFCAR
jgi:hypothetical protein